MIAHEERLAAAGSRLDRRLQGHSMCVCAGAGGVGKTTISAALALGLAAAGQRVVVITIDPARRLATALGLAELGGEPRRIDLAGVRVEGLADAGTPMGTEAGEPRGELWAMMLDPKETFDELVGRLAPDERAREEVLANHIYRELSSAVAGSQEFTAIAKLYELHTEGRFDMIVLDTPPARETLDVLSAPERISEFLEGRALRAFLAPDGVTARLLGRGTGMLFAAVGRVTGIEVLEDLSAFFRALGGMLEGFHEQVVAVASLLRDPGSAFLIVTTPERGATREAKVFAAHLDRAGIARAGLIVNRVHTDGLGGVAPDRARALLAQHFEDRMARRVADNLADFDALQTRDRASVAELGDALRETAPILVAELESDVQDLAGLARIATRLFA
jgi:anion-transporting  ArsA/GET3 family ATPase